jgi:ATP-dependent RNA helicase DDX42
MHQINYAPFNKDFYEEHADIAALDGFRVQQIRRDFGMRVSGMDPPKPCLSFAHFGFDEVRPMGAGPGAQGGLSIGRT